MVDGLADTLLLIGVLLFGPSVALVSPMVTVVPLLSKSPRRVRRADEVGARTG